MGLAVPASGPLSVRYAVSRLCRNTVQVYSFLCWQNSPWLFTQSHLPSASPFHVDHPLNSIDSWSSYNHHLPFGSWEAQQDPLLGLGGPADLARLSLCWSWRSARGRDSAVCRGRGWGDGRGHGRWEGVEWRVGSRQPRSPPLSPSGLILACLSVSLCVVSFWKEGGMQRERLKNQIPPRESVPSSLCLHTWPSHLQHEALAPLLTLSWWVSVAGSLRTLARHHLRVPKQLSPLYVRELC